MPFDTRQEKKNDQIYYYSRDLDNAKEKDQVVYVLNLKTKKITFHPRDEKLKFIKIFTLDGFSKLPDIFSPIGYIKGSSLQYYLIKLLSDAKVSSLNITAEGKNSAVKTGAHLKLEINYKDIKSLYTNLNAINKAKTTEKANACKGFFNGLFPSLFKGTQVDPKAKIKSFVSSLDTTLIDSFGKAEVDKLIDFFETFLEKHETSVASRIKVLTKTKLKVDKVALSDVISRFEKLLAEDPPEEKWGQFLQENLFLIESRYVHAIPKLNVSLGGSREMDFGLVDSQGYLDIFEIKKPSTELLASTMDRGNHYWHTSAVKSIVQAEKYLYNAERKAPVLSEDIKRNKNIEVTVIRPRTVLVIGHSKQLNNDSKKEDFRVLRTSLKNIELVTYDELLNRLKNQLSKSANIKGDKNL